MRKVNPHDRRTEVNNVETNSHQCFVCKETGHHKRDCPVHKETLKAKGINVEEYQADYDREKATSSGGGPARNGGTQYRGVVLLELGEELILGVTTQGGAVTGAVLYIMVQGEVGRKRTLFR